MKKEKTKDKSKEKAKEKKIQFNLLPKELGPRPVISLVTVLLLVVVIALGAATYLMYDGKSDADSKVDELKEQLATLEGQTKAALNNPEIAKLQGEIAKVQAQVNAQGPMKQDYESFMASWVNWDQVLAQLQSLATSTKVNLDSVTKRTGNTLELRGTAPNNKTVFDYVLALKARQDYFSSVGFPTVQYRETLNEVEKKTETESTFTLSVEVKSGGASQ